MGAAVVAAALVAAACSQAPTQVPATSSRPEKGQAVAIPCGTDSSQIGTIGYLASGAKVPDALALQVLVFEFPTHPALVFVSPADQAATTGADSTLAISSLLATSAPVMAQDSDPTLRSCAYDLSDKPRAAALASAAKDAIVASGEATSAQVNDVGVVTTISDEPLDSSLAVVVVRVAGSPISGFPVPVLSYGPLVVLVNLATGAVDSVGTPTG
jgi:hypothetical protein